MNFEAQTYKELDSGEAIFDFIKDKPVVDWFFQLKRDGIWCRLVIENGTVKYYSKTGQLKNEVRAPDAWFSRGPHVLIGEYMYGSQRSTNLALAGKFFAFDCVIADGVDASSGPYSGRYMLAKATIDWLADPRFELVRCYSMSKYPELLTLMEDKEEGFIFRSWRQPYTEPLLKFKYEVEDDFVVLRVVEGLGKHTGRMGALELGQYDPVTGKLVYVQNVGGGFTDEQRQTWWDGRDYGVGHVVLVRGKGRFHDGALRSPEFIQIRTDKRPTECIIKRTSR